MRDYWLTQYLLAAVGWTYIIVVLIATALALWLPKSKQSKVWATVIVIVLSTILPLKGYQGYRKNLQETNAYKVRLEKAQALFAERCKTAGEKIYRTVDGVEGIFLINIRPETVKRDDQFERYDPYGYQGGGDEYIRSFLPGRWPACVGSSPECPAEKRAFSFVEVQTKKEGINRYTTIDPETGKPLLPKTHTAIKLIAEPVASGAANYGVQWEDISSDADRQAWIAGGRLAIVDLKTKVVIAERTGFLLDPGQGSRGGFRSPWGWARTYAKGCPSVDGHNFVFVRKILKPVQGE
jgi:hypothetical protein